jgi:vancomycin resistance protein YoaR
VYVGRSLVVATAIAAVAVVVGLVFAGSTAKIPSGVRVAGVDVGGLTPVQAQDLLERRARDVAHRPVTFVAGSRTWKLTPAQLGVKVDWAAAVAAAEREGEGFAPVRGLRRLGTRFFGSDVAPPARVYDPALQYALGRIAKSVDRPARDASVALRGLRPVVVSARTGLGLDRDAAAAVIVRSLASFATGPVGLPVRVQRPAVAADDLEQAVADVRTAVSAPVRLRLGPTRWRIPRWRVAELLSLPRDGRSAVRVGGPGATRWFERLGRRVNRPARDAGFGVRADNTVFVVPARRGSVLDVRATAKGVLAAALSTSNRSAPIVVQTALPKRSTSEARAMGISRLVQAYTTTYGGEPNRLHNVRLVARLIDNTLIAPGSTFSFNGTTGERTADKGFLEAPVIINGELQTGLGGGICQVSTTVFNAAYEAGLPIVERTNHALYISHYPQGRDATVNYPDLDMRFRNDTGRWLLLRTWVGSSSLTVALYGQPTGRRVETEERPLVVTGAPTVKRVPDPALYEGVEVTDDSGEPSRSTSVRRLVYARSGKLLSDSTWSSYYRSEPQVVRYGTKPRPKPATPTTTAPTETTPGGTTQETTTTPEPKPKPSASSTTPPPARPTPPPPTGQQPPP